MPTINKSIADTLLANNGYYPIEGLTLEELDPQATSILSYENMFDGNHSYAVCYTINQLLGYLESRACTDPLILGATQEVLDTMRKMADAEETKDIADLVYNNFVSTKVIVFTVYSPS